MGLYSKTNKTTRIIFASLAMMAATSQLSTAFSGELAAAAPSLKSKSKGPTTSPTATQLSAPAFRARIENIDPASGTWNRTPSRSSGLWTHSQVDPRKKTTIQFASASGTDEGVTSTVAESTSLEANDSAVPADNSLAAAAETNATSDEKPAPGISSASVKEQLLNALRMQRKAIANPNALKPTTPPGSLTIMNSSKVITNSPAESTKQAAHLSAAPTASTPLSPALPTLTNQTDLAADGQKPAMQPKSAKSYAGLTRTLEEDLKSNDPYLRERAQLFLRLQMQLLQLRARQAAAAEATTKMTPNNTGDNSIPVNPGDTGAATQPLNPSHDSTSGSTDGRSDPNAHEPQPSDGHSSTQNSNDPNALTSHQKTQPEEVIADGNMSEESPLAPLEPSANASLLENVVVDGAIDRLGLANNFFAVGEYTLALEMYEQTTGLELSSQQQFWVQYQLANCLRRLGKTAEASNRYRKLASQPEAGWLSQQAQWWVETLESIRILEKAMKDHSVEQSLKVIENVEAAVVVPPAENTATSTVSE